MIIILVGLRLHPSTLHDASQPPIPHVQMIQEQFHTSMWRGAKIEWPNQLLLNSSLIQYNYILYIFWTKDFF